MNRTAVAALLAVLAATVSVAAESDERANAAYRAFDEAYQDRDPAALTKALRGLGAIDRPGSAKRLVRVATSKHPYPLRTEALKALGGQKSSPKLVATSVGKLLVAEAKYKRKGIVDVVLDQDKNVVTTTPEAKRALQLLVDRNGFREACVRCLGRIGDWRHVRMRDLLLILETGHDGLTLALIESFARHRDWRALPGLCELYRIYPSERSWTVNHILLQAFRNEEAKLLYMERFGDPGILQPRAEVHRSVRQALTTITGESFESPAALMGYLKRADVKRKMEQAPRDVKAPG